MVPLNTQPRYYYTAYAPPQPTTPYGVGNNPNTKVDSVRIDIVNPQAGGLNQPTAPKPMQIQPNNWYYPPAPLPIQQPAMYRPPVMPPAPQTQQIANTPPVANDPKNLSATNLKTDRSAEKEAKTQKNEPVPVQELPKVSSELIKKLDKGLNSTDEQTRVNTASELSLMCENDPEFAKDPRITNLINRMLKDFNPNVRFFGLTAVDLGAAQNAETEKLLNKLSGNKDPLGDPQLVNSIMLKKSKPKKVAFEGKSEQVKNSELTTNPNNLVNTSDTASTKQFLA